MAIADSQVLEDRFSALDAGMNSNIVYSSLPKNQASFLVNATCRNGFAQQRPGFPQITLRFADLDTEDLWNTGKFQGAAFFPATVPQLIVSIGGNIFMVAMDTFLVTNITIPGDPNPGYLDFAYMELAEQWLIIQDGLSSALIWDGGGLRRANRARKEVPTGTAMAYGQGRLWVAINGNQFVASDIVGGPSGTPAYNYRNAVLRFTENDYIAGGGAFSVSLQSGAITAMKFVANLNTALGEGALMVFTRNGVFSVQVPLDRTQWQNTTAPIQTIAQINYGSVSPSVTAVNGDLFYRSTDGIRSLSVAVRYFGQWGNVPISVEMSTPLDTDNQNLIPKVTTALFDNRLFVSTIPQKTPRGTAFTGLVALDFNLISSLRGEAPPAYDGVWCGLKTLQMVKSGASSGERCFMFVVNPSDDAIELWEMSKDKKVDGANKRVQWVVEGPGLPFNNPGELKSLFYGDMWVDKLNGAVDFSVSFRPDYNPTWVPWSNFSKCATMSDCRTGNCATFTEAQEQYRPRIRFPQPTDDCDSVNQKLLRQFYVMQIRFQMTGYCRLMLSRTFARILQEPAVGDCPAEEACVAQTSCNINPYSYSSQ